MESRISKVLQNLVSKAMLQPISVVESSQFEPHLPCKSDSFQGNHQNWQDSYHQ